MNKGRVTYIVLLILFVVFVIGLDIIFYMRYSNISGKLSINRKFYDINYITDNSNVKLYNGDINVNIKNLDEEVYFDIYNSGNINATLDSVSFKSITSNLEEENFTITSSLQKNDVIKGGETRRVYINITCENCNKDTELAFNTEYVFTE